MKFVTSILLLFGAATTTSALEATRVARGVSNPVLDAEPFCCTDGPIGGPCACLSSSVEACERGECI
ncbi:hypothetical protein LZ30DRAFT_724042 [Colletotrichum cereale]|nr:hypothetical protein LZ30DRAFT_724042 [Colletotrichum cereale]